MNSQLTRAEADIAWLKAERERAQKQLDESARREAIRKQIEEQQIEGITERLNEAADRAHRKLKEQIAEWIIRNKAASGADVHTRPFYAEHIMESAALTMSLSRRAATLVGSSQDATKVMQDWENEVAYLSLLSLLMLERQRGEIARRVALRLATKRTGDDQ